MVRIISIPSFKELGLSILLGVLAIMLSLLVQIEVPGASVKVSFFEIPLLISLFYLTGPISLALLVGISSTVVFAFTDVSYAATFVSHFASLTIVWFGYQNLKKTTLNKIYLGFAWFIITILYYCLLLAPLIIICRSIISTPEVSFFNSYAAIISGARYEILPTAMVSAFYLIQHEHRAALELIVTQRTKEISEALKKLQQLNSDLHASNEEVKTLNENLEKLVLERTTKINKQFEQLKRYVDINAHEVRAPLARLLGLLSLLKIETDEALKVDLLDKINSSSEELDAIIKKMNSLLESEIYNSED